MDDGGQRQRERRLDLVFVATREKEFAAFNGEALDSQAFDREAFVKLVAREIVNWRSHAFFSVAQAGGEALHRQTFNGGKELGRRSEVAAQHGKAQHQFTFAQWRLPLAPDAWTQRRRIDEHDSAKRRKRLSRAILELQPREAGVESAASVEARVSAFFDDPPLIHNDDAIGGADCGKSVSNDDGGAMLHQPIERILHEPFAFRVERGRRFV